MAVNYKFIDEKVGLGNVSQVDAAPLFEVGYIAIAKDPTYGVGEFIYTKFTGTVAAGDIVAVDRYASTCVQSPAAAANAKGLAFGVAMGAAVAGQYGFVMVRGVHDGANVATGTAAGSTLSGSATAGRASTGVANYNLDLAVCKTLAAANVATVELYWPVCTGR